MERSQSDKNRKKRVNRSISYLVLVASVFLFYYSFSNIYKYIKIYNENIVLNQTLDEIKDENERLKLINAKLKDGNYLSFYVKDGYQYDGENIIEIED